MVFNGRSLQKKEHSFPWKKTYRFTKYHPHVSSISVSRINFSTRFLLLPSHAIPRTASYCLIKLFNSPFVEQPSTTKSLKIRITPIPLPSTILCNLRKKISRTSCHKIAPHSPVSQPKWVRFHILTPRIWGCVKINLMLAINFKIIKQFSVSRIGYASCVSYKWKSRLPWAKVKAPAWHH